MKSLVIKLSSGLIIQDKRSEWLEDFARLIRRLYAQGYDVCLVTSGAAALARQFSAGPHKDSRVAAIEGQPLLFDYYSKALKKYSDIDSAQILLSKDDFKSRSHYLRIRDTLHELHRDRIIPLVNENDALNKDGSNFSDNDEIAGLLASLLGSERLIIASVVEGLLDQEGHLVRTVKFEDDSWRKFIKEEKSVHGRGGMKLKCLAAKNLAARGISTTICSGFETDELYKAALGHNIGTQFTPNRELSAKKRWILDHAQFADASVEVDKKAAEIMNGNKATSLLMVGVTYVDGTFQKGDVIAVIDPEKNIIGYGQTQFSYEQAIKLIGKQAEKPLIHYDYYAGVS